MRTPSSVAPEMVASIARLVADDARRASASSARATTSAPPDGAATAAYSISGWTAIAMLAGSVHGVVVQMARRDGARRTPANAGG